MSKKKPLKPLKSTGFISFPKRGPVQQVVKDWPRTKPDQELQVVRLFANALATHCDRNLDDIQILDEANHDAVAIESGIRTEIQVTEIVTRGMVRELGGGAVTWTPGELDDLLLQAILKKVDRYPPSQAGRLLLLVYSVDSLAVPLFSEGNRGDEDEAVPDALRVARTYLSQHEAGPFDEVWFIAPIVDVAFLSAIYPPSLYE